MRTKRRYTLQPCHHQVYAKWPSRAQEWHDRMFKYVKDGEVLPCAGKVVKPTRHRENAQVRRIAEKIADYLESQL